MFEGRAAAPTSDQIASLTGRRGRAGAHSPLAPLDGPQAARGLIAAPECRRPAGREKKPAPLEPA
ncbi:hypothetical protein CAL14_18525 [Bordetella genomosp. 9]|nr:hypothetical protein CAL14_18525 [Bordetella genomosp. 9]